MPLFIVASTEEDSNEILGSIIPERFPNSYYEMGEGLWLVSFDGTAKALFENELEDEDADNILNGCVVLRFSSYWGRYTPDMWEWIDTMKAGDRRA